MERGSLTNSSKRGASRDECSNSYCRFSRLAMRRDYASRMDFVLDRFDLAVGPLEAGQIELPELRERLPKGVELA